MLESETILSKFKKGLIIGSIIFIFYNMIGLYCLFTFSHSKKLLSFFNRSQWIYIYFNLIFLESIEKI